MADELPAATRRPPGATPRSSASTTGTKGLLLVNSVDGGVRALVLDALGATTDQRHPADPQRLQRAFDALPRLSVSNVGVRNTYGGGRGTASYKMFVGSGVDRGMREVDTAQAAIGHAMAQVSEGPGKAAYNTGFAVEKAKIWESRYVPLRSYIGQLLNTLGIVTTYEHVSSTGTGTYEHAVTLHPSS